jgi:hypothetical protein
VLDYGVIADVSETLQQVLSDALAPLGSIAEVHDLQGIISTTPARLTLFLFEVSEDPSARNRPRQREVAGATVMLKKPPMALLLRYLVSPWSGARITDHRILGRAMQTLYDNAIVSGPALRGGLAGTDQALKITVAALTVEERARVWYSVQKPYRLSVAYEVRVVNLVSEASDAVPAVARRSLDYAAGGATS